MTEILFSGKEACQPCWNHKHSPRNQSKNMWKLSRVRARVLHQPYWWITPWKRHPSSKVSDMLHCLHCIAAPYLQCAKPEIFLLFFLMLYYALPARFTMVPWIKFWRPKELHTGNTKTKYISYINWSYMPVMKVMKILLSILGVLTFGPTFPSNS